jgi:hypothetical protein
MNWTLYTSHCWISRSIVSVLSVSENEVCRLTSWLS